MSVQLEFLPLTGHNDECATCDNSTLSMVAPLFVAYRVPGRKEIIYCIECAAKWLRPELRAMLAPDANPKP